MAHFHGMSADSSELLVNLYNEKVVFVGPFVILAKSIISTIMKYRQNRLIFRLLQISHFRLVNLTVGGGHWITNSKGSLAVTTISLYVSLTASDTTNLALCVFLLNDVNGR